MRQFTTLEELGATRAGEYLRRGDFSRWMADVFGEHALAHELQGYEQEHDQSSSRDVVGRIVAAVRSRYELTEENDAGVAA